jgi:hypothetical protein
MQVMNMTRNQPGNQPYVRLPFQACPFIKLPRDEVVLGERHLPPTQLTCALNPLIITGAATIGVDQLRQWHTANAETKVPSKRTG